MECVIVRQAGRAVTVRDINECLNVTICQDNSQCQNTNGSYICVCNDGYIRSGDVCIGESNNSNGFEF